MNQSLVSFLKRMNDATLAIDVDAQSFQCRIIRRKTKRFVLKVSPRDGLQCLCPMRAKERDIYGFIEGNRAWVSGKQSLLKLAGIYATEKDVLPQSMTFGFDATRFKIDYENAYRTPRVVSKPGSLIVYSNGSCEKVRSLLKEWIKNYASLHLGGTLCRLSQEKEMPYASHSFGYAKMRWGSCRRDNAIRLNPLLIFLPQAIIEHVILHELSHTIHHNHSPDFWNLLQELDPMTSQHKAYLSDQVKSHTAIPAFFW